MPWDKNQQLSIFNHIVGAESSIMHFVHGQEADVAVALDCWEKTYVTRCFGRGANWHLEGTQFIGIFTLRAIECPKTQESAFSNLLSISSTWPEPKDLQM